MNDLPNDQQVKSNTPADSAGRQATSSSQSVQASLVKEREVLLPLEKAGAAREVEIPPEVKDVGVQPIQDEIEILQGVPSGVIHAGPETPIVTQPTGVVKLPLTDEEIEKALHHKIVDSILWLATWCLRQIKITHRKVLSYGGN